MNYISPSPTYQGKTVGFRAMLPHIWTVMTRAEPPSNPSRSSGMVKASTILAWASRVQSGNSHTFMVEHENWSEICTQILQKETWPTCIAPEKMSVYRGYPKPTLSSDFSFLFHSLTVSNHKFPRRSTTVNWRVVKVLLKPCLLHDFMPRFLLLKGGSFGAKLSQRIRRRNRCKKRIVNSIEMWLPVTEHLPKVSRQGV